MKALGQGDDGVPSYFQYNGDARLTLDRLNSAERQVLEMLAQGHTVKSISRLTGRSESAVNERLREARRKTGVGSSRELARLLSTQKNRDEEIGVTRPAQAGAGAMGRAAPAWAKLVSNKGVSIMILILGATAAVLLLKPTETGPPRSSRSSINDPVDEFAMPADGPRNLDLHLQVRREIRDKVWAAGTEAALGAQYGQIPNLGGSSAVTRAICGSTLCEVAGTIDPNATSAAKSSAVQSLQDPRLREDVRQRGLGDVMITFGPLRTDARTMAFVAYWKRFSP